jgi:hypothetical protein
VISECGTFYVNQRQFGRLFLSLNNCLLEPGPLIVQRFTESFGNLFEHGGS